MMTTYAAIKSAIAALPAPAPTDSLVAVAQLSVSSFTYTIPSV